MNNSQVSGRDFFLTTALMGWDWEITHFDLKNRTTALGWNVHLWSRVSGLPLLGNNLLNKVGRLPSHCSHHPFVVLFLQSFGNDYSQSHAIPRSQVGSGKGTGGRALGTQRSGGKCLIEVKHLNFYEFFSLHYSHLLLKELILFSIRI